MVRTLYFHFREQEVQVQTLVRELRPCVLQPKNRKKKNAREGGNICIPMADPC